MSWTYISVKIGQSVCDMCQKYMTTFILTEFIYFKICNQPSSLYKLNQYWNTGIISKTNLNLHEL